MKQFKLKTTLTSNKKIKKLVEQVKTSNMILNSAWYQDTKKALAYLKECEA